jgi:hypothetical protein
MKLPLQNTLILFTLADYAESLKAMNLKQFNMSGSLASFIIDESDGRALLNKYYNYFLR